MRHARRTPEYFAVTNTCEALTLPTDSRSHITCDPRPGIARETERGLVAAGSWGSEGVGATAPGQRVSFRSDGQFLELSSGEDGTILKMVKMINL